MHSDDKCENDDLHIVPSASGTFGQAISDGSRSSSSHSIHKKELFPNGSCRLPWPACFPDEDAEPNAPCSSPNFAVGDTANNSELSGEENDVTELDDMLRRFETFFREKVDTELQSLQEFMHGFLSEQQLHLRQILYSSHFPKSPLHHPEVDELIVPREETVHSSQVQGSLDETEMQLSIGSTDCYGRPSKNELLLELMSLSCELSALLSQPRFL